MISSVLRANTASGQALAKRDYWRDNRDRVLAWKRGSDPTYNLMENGRGNRYEYDDEGQLTRASYRAENPENGATTPARNDIFQYDKLGNRKGWNYLASRGSMLFKGKNNGLNQYFSWENNYPSPPLHWGTTTNYDDDLGGWGQQGRANGVLMQEGWITGFYNAMNQPVGMTPTAWIGTGNWMWFGYDPLGRCVKRWVGPHAGTPPNLQVPPANTNPATYYYYDGWNLIQEGATGVPPSRVYVHGGRTDEIVASWAGGNWNQHQYDAQGNCILLTDTDGLIREQYDYDAFGFPYVYDRWGNYIGGLEGANRFLFTGREWIKELRLYDYRNRMYQPELGRFLQPDPKEFAAGDYNLYRYCHNDPVNKSDPTGMLENIREDPQWKMNCFFDSGNSFQGSFGEFMGRSQARTVSSENQGKKEAGQQLRSPQQNYKIASDWLAERHKELDPERHKAKLEKLAPDREGEYHPMTGIKLDPEKLRSAAAFVGGYAHELLHAKNGAIIWFWDRISGNEAKRHEQINPASDRIREQFIQETGPRYVEPVNPDH